MIKDKSSPLYGIADCYVSQAWNTLGTRAVLEAFRNTGEDNAIAWLAKEARRLQREARRNAIERQVKHQHKTENEGLMYVNLCIASSRYGGPEEGGWYYTHYETVASIPVLAGASNRYIAYLKREIVRQNLDILMNWGCDVEYGGCGVGGCGDDEGMLCGEQQGDCGYDVFLSWGAPYEWEGRPHYE